MPVLSLMTQCPATLILVDGYGTGRKLTAELSDALELNVICVVWLVATVLLTVARPSALGSVPAAGAFAPRWGLRVQRVVDRLPSTYICRYCGAGSVVV